MNVLKERCSETPGGVAVPSAARRSISLPVVGSAPRIRPSRNSRWRALSLVVVHLIIIGHVLHWWWTGRTLSPVEPSEAMYTLNNGELNAGFIFFAVALLVTLVGGRWVCGWACHVVAYQDLCAWLLRRVGIHPKPFRSRLLVLAPLALALYMFVWPTVYRWCVDAPPPKLSNHLLTTDFWKTFPGPSIAILTVVVCGFAIVYFLGGKGFCTYACPYGGFFGVVDRFAPGRIRVTDDCEHCGHCTAVCTSNVRVHEEVATFGMVVDPGCMKCMDCVSVCPNDALYFGFSASRGLQPARPTTPPRKFDFTRTEELLFAIVGFGALLAYRGLYGQVPLLLAMGMAAMTGWIVIQLIHFVSRANVRFQNLSLKRGGRISTPGWAFAVSGVLLLAFVVHSGAVQWFTWSGQRAIKSVKIGDEVWVAGNDWWQRASDVDRATISGATVSLERAERWGLLSTPAVQQDLVWLYLAQGRLDAAEAMVSSLVDSTPDLAESHRGLANVLRMTGKFSDAEVSYRKALELQPTHARVRQELASMLLSQGRADDAKAELRRAVASGDTTVTLFSTLGMLELQTGEMDAGLSNLRRALAIDSKLAQVRYQLAVALLSQGDSHSGREAIVEAIEHLRRVTQERPDFAAAHYNLGVATFMSGRPADAVAHVEESLRLEPGDVQAQQFLAFLRLQNEPTPAP